MGGRSKRFGATKWRAKINGEPIINTIIKACQICDEIFLTGKNQPDDLTHIPFLKDKLDIQAPINGLFTALQSTNTDWILLISSDLPLITDNILLELLKYINNSKNIIIPKINGKLQPTCALYNKRLKNKCMKQIKNHRLSLTKFVINNNFDAVDFSLQSEAFININTKNDLRAAEIILSSKMSSK